MSKLTRQINGEWDFTSLEGLPKIGIVCHGCGDIVPLTYQQRGYGERYGYCIYSYCPNCFNGDKETALTNRLGQ